MKPLAIQMLSRCGYSGGLCTNIQTFSEEETDPANPITVHKLKCSKEASKT